MQKVTITAYNRTDDAPISEDEVVDVLMPIGLSDIYVQVDELEDEEDDDE
jgi:hypothetical protein